LALANLVSLLISRLAEFRTVRSVHHGGGATSVTSEMTTNKFPPRAGKTEPSQLFRGFSGDYISGVWQMNLSSPHSGGCI